MKQTVCFYLAYTLSLCLGLLCLLLVACWCSRWGGGFSWDGSALQFNWHPVLMVSGLVLLYGNGALCHRVNLGVFTALQQGTLSPLY